MGKGGPDLSVCRTGRLLGLSEPVPKKFQCMDNKTAYQHIKILRVVPKWHQKWFINKDQHTGLKLNAVSNVLIQVHTGYDRVIYMAGT